MEVDELPPIDPNVDYREIYPIHQKRTIAFINQFIMSTVSLLNEFAKSCESRLMEFEYKIQKVEASLLILESQLSSISGLDVLDPQTEATFDRNVTQENVEQTIDLPEIVKDDETTVVSNVPVVSENVQEIVSNVVHGPKACEDSRFSKFFKMVQFGVPPPAVKLKMVTEGIDPAILNKPNEVIEGYEISKNNTYSSSSSSSDIC